MAEDFKRQGYISDTEKYLKQLEKQIKRVLAYVVNCGKSRIVRKQGMFELFGCDFMIEKNLQVKLLEINTNPAIFTDTTV